MKIKELQKYMKSNKIDVAVLLSLHSMSYDSNVYYFTNYEGQGVLIIPKSSRPILMVPEMELERARKVSRIKNVFAFDRKAKMFLHLREILKKRKIKSGAVGIDYSSATVEQYRALRKGLKASKTRDIGNALKCIRGVKTTAEIKILGKGFGIADAIVRSAIRNFRKFKTEEEAANYMKCEAIKRNCGLSFPPIIASGKNASMPHYKPRSVPIQKGFCIIDFGVCYKGYCTDITRMVYVGKPTEKEVGLYNFLLRAQENAIRNVKSGIKGAKLYKNAVKDLRHYAKFFTHGLGHGVGIDIHEFPSLSPKSKDKIEKNMVFTIEPGLYLTGKFGMRIEDTILFNGKKAEILTKVPKRLVVVK
ncbi:MAG TPA: Xaa-Pro peptidase family protein [Candidatus Nanoarchaeia archaeon]|nr:Xaa-Pro peptidase family protein [Candidatus Nanoarchaeia archaeon]